MKLTLSALFVLALAVVVRSQQQVWTSFETERQTPGSESYSHPGFRVTNRSRSLIPNIHPEIRHHRHLLQARLLHRRRPTPELTLIQMLALTTAAAPAETSKPISPYQSRKTLQKPNLRPAVTPNRKRNPLRTTITSTVQATRSTWIIPEVRWMYERLNTCS